MYKEKCHRSGSANAIRRAAGLVHHLARAYGLHHSQLSGCHIHARRSLIKKIFCSTSSFGRSIHCQTDDEFEERMRSNPLYKYATQNRVHHARSALGLRPSVVDFPKTKSTLKLQAKHQHPTNRVGGIRITVRCHGPRQEPTLQPTQD